MAKHKSRSIPRGWGRTRARRRVDGSLVFQALWMESLPDGRSTERSRSFASQTEATNHLRLMAAARGDQPKRAVGYILPTIGTVYFIQPRDGGPIKIGFAQDPQARLAEIQMCSPVPLVIIATILGDRESEAALHRCFQPLRTHGEWFRPEEVLLRWIDSNATTWDEKNLIPDSKAA